MNHLRTNNIRGYLAEFLVARAVGSRSGRVEWDSWDVTAPDNTRIEVKSSGYLQAWAQKRLSVPTFRVSAAYGWDATRGEFSRQQAFNADVYVFCLHTAKTHDEYDPLNISQWKFYVAGREAIEARAGVQMGLAALAKVAGAPVIYNQLNWQFPLPSIPSRPRQAEPRSLAGWAWLDGVGAIPARSPSCPPMGS